MLIILYGKISNKENWKQQRMIDGGATCGYREYAKSYGHIIYLCPQKVQLSWEHSIVNPKKVKQFISQHPGAIVWSVKHDPHKDTEILSQIKNRKVYYSCNSSNMYNRHCNVSLVDTKARLKHNAKLWFKGKSEAYWIPTIQKKEFDYLLIGTRGDKNEVYFLKKLNEIKERRRILWIGGKKHEHKISTNHEIVCTPFLGQDAVRDTIPTAKVHILFTELKIEGFPQSAIETQMCGLPVVYNQNAPINGFYLNSGNFFLCSKKNLIAQAENVLRNYHGSRSITCRQNAIEHLSLEKSYKRIFQCLK